MGPFNLRIMSNYDNVNHYLNEFIIKQISLAMRSLVMSLKSLTLAYLCCYFVLIRNHSDA